MIDSDCVNYNDNSDKKELFWNVNPRNGHRV